MEVPVVETELEIIEKQIGIAADCYKDNKTPADDTLKNISQTLYDNLFGWRDAQPERPLQRPVKYNLVEIFKELKFGRPSEDQIFLQKCIENLEK